MARILIVDDDESILRLLEKYLHGIDHTVVVDTNTVYGEVKKKYTEDGEHRVEVYVQNENQAGLTTAFATAIVELPSMK